MPAKKVDEDLSYILTHRDGDERVGIMARNVEVSRLSGIKSLCTCGQKLPWHLFTLGPLEHKCSCGRIYDSDGSTVRLIKKETPEPWQTQ